VHGVLASLPGGELAVNEAIFKGLSRGWPKDKPVRLDEAGEGALRRLAAELTPPARAMLVRLASLWGNRTFEVMGTEIAGSLLATARNAKLAEPARIDAARQLIELRASDDAISRQVLDLIVEGGSPELAAGILEAISQSRSPQAGTALAQSLPKLRPRERSRALRLMLGRSEWAPALVDALEHDKARISELALDQKQALQTHPDKNIAARAKVLLEKGGGLPDADRQKVLDRLIPLLKEGGDSIRGKVVFQEQCSKCHRYGTTGGQVGPDLTGTAAVPRTELLTHIIDPSRSVEGNFVQYTVATKDGRVINGLLSSETKTSVELIDAEAKRQVVLREDIDEMAVSKKSLMPEGFEKQVSTDDIKNLLAFLTQPVKFIPLDMRKAATVVSTKGMFFDEDSEIERLIFPDWAPKTVDGVPFGLVDPEAGHVPNAVLLYGPQGKVPPQMPRSVELNCRSKAKAIHLLSGISGWGYPYGEKGSVSMVVRLHYADGSIEDHPLENGVHFADYIRVVDVPGSKLAFRLRGRQVRYLAVVPKKHDVIDRIELQKGPDQSAPIVMAVTVEVGDGT
jgi:putative heme-binding domain-containing protein